MPQIKLRKKMAAVAIEFAKIKQMKQSKTGWEETKMVYILYLVVVYICDQCLSWFVLIIGVKSQF